MYKLRRDSNYIIRTRDTACIPDDITNSDYVEYLNWVSQGNTPLPADPIQNPAIAAIDAQLAEIDRKSIRPAREGDAVFLATLTAQAVELRTARSLLPKIVQ
ncbi:MAG: hypothetical protein WC236_14525 [Gallionellaceae bacterium]|jgi:hypothetical protein